MGKMFSLHQLKSCKTLQVFRFTDSHYVGETNEEGMRHGIGVMVYKSGRRYEGQWAYDKREGVGYEYYANGHIYQGEYKNGKPEGKGLY